MFCFLSGGTGTPKLLRGFQNILYDFCVVVNIAEDIWISGNKVCPDIDSVIYALSGLIDDTKWWGVKNDTFTTHNALKKLGFEEMLMIGDIDRSTHIFRSEMLRRGFNLLEVTEMLRNIMGIKPKVFPACNEEVQTYVKACGRWMHFQEFWIKHRGKLKVEAVDFRGIEKSKIPEEVEKTLNLCKAIIIGPSNPITSIMPILKVNGYSKILNSKKVLAISPIIGDKAVSGPAVNLMNAMGYEPTPLGVVKCYQDFLDAIVLHNGDSEKIRNIKNLEVFETNIIMKTKEDEIRLAKFVSEILDSL